MEKTYDRNREQWMDVVKLLGIIAVFVGHFGELAGGSYRFVYLYQNALFFFCAGYLHSKKQYDSFHDFFIKKCKRLLFPGIAFSLLVLVVSTLFQMLSGMADMRMIRENIISIFLLKGLGLGNWFFTGLLSVSVFFEIINRIVGKMCKMREGGQTLVPLVACVVIGCVPDSLISKLQFCNFYSVFSYGIYYALGFFFCTIANRKTMMRRNDTKWVHVLGVAALAVSAYMYFLCLNDEVIIPFISTVIIIIANLYVAKILEGCTILAKWGRFTMYCCGNEYIIRHTFDKMVHLNNWINSKIILEICCWILATVFVWIVIYFLYPLESCLVENLSKKAKSLVKDR